MSCKDVDAKAEPAYTAPPKRSMTMAFTVCALGHASRVRCALGMALGACGVRTELGDNPPQNVQQYRRQNFDAAGHAAMPIRIIAVPAPPPRSQVPVPAPVCLPRNRKES